MDGTSKRWNQVTPSQFAWEADAQETLRALLPDQDPYRGWTNFEFINRGAISEVDSLVITPKGVYLIEIKSWAGKITGDQGTWVQQRPDGSRQSFTNQAAVNSRKVRQLAGLIKNNWPHNAKLGPPFIQSLVWFSHADVSVQLPSELHSEVAVDDNTRSAIQTLSDAIINIGADQHERFSRITAQQSADFAAAMERIGFKESTRKRKVASWELELPAMAERGATQDFWATNDITEKSARVRIYSNVADIGSKAAVALKQAARREFLATNPLRVPGVVRALDVVDTDLGPAVILDQSPKAIRLDQFLAERTGPLARDDALSLWQQLASIVRDLHKRGVTHRMLTPESVWLTPTDKSTGDRTVTIDGTAHYRLAVSDLSLAGTDDGDRGTSVGTTTRVGTLPVVRSGHVEVVLGDPSAATYLAPEGLTHPDSDGQSLDVFSVGAIAHLLLTRRAPAANVTELRDVLGSGLSPAAFIDGLDVEIDALVRQCTTPIVSDRPASMSQVLGELTRLRTDSDHGGPVDPLAADKDDVLAERFEVRRRLGQGSTALALWCTDNETEVPRPNGVVLKVSLGEASDSRLASEGQALTNLRHENVVECLDHTLVLEGRPTLVLSFAGEHSLEHYLRAEGPVSPEFLQRWGDDLLEAIRYLERSGVAHRDVKPDNIGIVELGSKRQQRLVLFDFSLTAAAAADVSAGTPPYLEPFLAADKDRGFDLAAERYAAAVTLHRMATGETPSWGDGRSDPAYLPDDITVPTLVEEAMDPELRTELSAFLLKALDRDPNKRFDTADDMARAWQQVFAGWEADDSTTASDDEPADHGASPVSRSKQRVNESLVALDLDDPISSLDTSAKVRSALRKLGAEQVRQVASLDPMQVNRTKGVAPKTRRTVIQLRAAVLKHFAKALAATKSTVAEATDPEPSTAATSTTAPSGAVSADAAAATDITSAPGSPGTETSEAAPAAPEAVPGLDLDRLALQLLPDSLSSKPNGPADQVRALLGLTQPGVLPASAHPADWPTQAAVAEALGVTRATVSHSHQKVRNHWAKAPDVAAVCADLVDLLLERGGVAGVSQLTAPLIDLRGTGTDGAEATALASAVIHAAINATEVKPDTAPSATNVGASAAFVSRRFGRRTLLAIDGSALEAMLECERLDPNRWDRDVRRRLAAMRPTPLIDLAVAIGAQADKLVARDNLVAAGQAVAALRASTPRNATPIAFSDSSLVRLAVAASDHAATNAISNLFPVDIDVTSALRWSRPVLVGFNRLTPAELAQQVAVRFPTVVLPTGDELRQAVNQAELPFEWSTEAEAFVAKMDTPGGLSTFTRGQSRMDTSTGSLPERSEITQADRAAADIDEALARSQRRGGFLALRVPNNLLVPAQRGLARFQGGDDGLTRIDLEATFMTALRSEADGRRVDWDTLVAADDTDGSHWVRLEALAGPAVDATIAEVTKHERVLAWFPGALVRYGVAAPPAPLDRLREAANSGQFNLRLLWLVVLGASGEARPSVDGVPVPVQATDEWLDLTKTWLTNAHRAGASQAS